MSTSPNSPVIIAVAQQTWREADATRTPVLALSEVVNKALDELDGTNQKDCRQQVIDSIDKVATVRFITDSNADLIPLLPRNPGLLMAKDVGIENATFHQTDLGGNSPQFLVNHFAKQLADGTASTVLISGVELLGTFFDAMKTGSDISQWPGEPTDSPEMIGIEKDGVNNYERAHGLYEPINTYPLFENALRHKDGANEQDESRLTAELCSQMSAVAANNPFAWRPEALDAESIATVTKKNRYVGYPYTRAMNAVLSVDMGAALIMTTAGKAAEMGIDNSQLIYLRAGADVNEIWNVTERDDWSTAPAIGIAAKAVLAHSKLPLADISAFDIYSCFPCAVRIACNEIGLSPLDERGITVTGGLPFFGGPGNNYSLHAITEMVDRLRKEGKGHGLVTANGLYLTKHSMGVYSTEPGADDWQAIDSAALQSQIDSGPHCDVVTEWNGPATIEHLTITFNKQGPEKAIIVAKNAQGQRLLANATSNLEKLIDEDFVGVGCNVRTENGVNVIEL